MSVTIAQARAAQAYWSRISITDRLAIVRRARQLIAKSALELAATVPHNLPSSLQRNTADTLVAEVLPLAEAFRFLERQAAPLLRVKNLGGRNRPIWLHGVSSQVQRVPLGVVLLIAPSNYPLLLPGVQSVQALVAGNAVLWKPAFGGESAANKLADLFESAGLPPNLLQILPAHSQNGTDAIRAGVDKVFLTGHADTGRAVMRDLARTLTPSVMELSGCDAVFLLPGADLRRAAEALAFGMRLNGSATCMAPRRVFASASIANQLLAELLPKMQQIPAVQLQPKTSSLLDALLEDAERKGALIVKDGRQADHAVTPSVLIGGAPSHLIMQTDIFAPVLTFCTVADESEALKASAACPYALAAAVFGPPREAAVFADRLSVGTVLINDIIVSTADPRVSFGGRGASGYGVTRGREGLLEMTAIKTVLTQKSRSLRPYAHTGRKHEAFFVNFIQAMHTGSLKGRLQAALRLFHSARDVEK